MGTPVFGTENRLTDAELHALFLGATVGVLAGYAYGIGLTLAATAVTSLFVALSLGVQANGTVPMAQRTVRREPWYALAALVAGGVVGVVVA
jgi:Mg/Co/Ni transporter MgtE